MIKYNYFVIILKSPTVIRLVGYESRKKELETRLTFLDKAADWTYRKFVDNPWNRSKLSKEEYARELSELLAKRKRCLLFEDEQGLWTYSGLRNVLKEEYGEDVIVEYELPEPKLVPWDKKPEYDQRYYQEESVLKLLEAAKYGPAAISIGTGLGKTFISLNLVKQLGLKTVIIVPTKSIARQTFKYFLKYFGRSKVGLFGDGKKEFNKLITIGIGASLTRCEPGQESYEVLSKTKVLIGDESHMLPSKTLSKVCFGLLDSPPYRFFMSGTQMRNDGLDLLLDGIIGPIVYEMSVQEGVDRGFLAKPIFKMCWIDSDVVDHNRNVILSKDAQKNNKRHLFYSKSINKEAAEFANKCVSLLSRPTLILIDELNQLNQLISYLRYEFKVAHGGMVDEEKHLIPKQYHKSDPELFVEEFNEGKFPILIGTSCIGIGTDIKPVRAIINLRGGKSEVEISQNIGRGTRKIAGKEDFLYIDFGFRNVEMLKKHALERMKIFNKIYPSLSEVQL